MNRGAHLEETSRGLQVNILLSTNHTHTGPASRVATGQPNVIAFARMRNEADASLLVVLVHCLADELQVTLGYILCETSVN